MASKIMVIISTAEKEKALTGIMYAVNAQKNGWVDEVKVVFFGPFEQAEKHALDGWETFPIRRSEKRESFSQVLFRSLNIPEAQSVGASNITMHQVMRLLYSDQRTPSTRLFRFESFDKQDIREAVGDLICGISGYEIYEISRLR